MASRAAGSADQLSAGDGVASSQLTQLGGGAAEGITLADDYAPQLQSKENQAFVAKWRAKYKADPDTFAALAYDATNVVIAAMKSGASDREAIQKALKNTKNFVGVTGPITFDKQNDAARNVYMLNVKSGAITLNSEQLKDGKIVPASEIIK